MTDVARKIITANPTRNADLVVGGTNCRAGAVRQHGTNDAIPMSGVNGQTTNGYLDNRFDDPGYYDA